MFNAAIEHFTSEEIHSIMKNIKHRLTKEGILSGYTLVESEDKKTHLKQHEIQFKDMKDLARFLTPYFKNVKVFETIYPSRHNLNFWASNGVLPFDKDWSAMLHQHKSR